MHQVVDGQDEPTSVPFFGPGLRVTPVWNTQPDPHPDSPWAPQMPL